MANGSRRRNEPPTGRITFGQLAVRKGYVTPAHVEEALRIQRELIEQSGIRKLIGMIMLEMGALGTTELIDVVKELSGHPNRSTTVIRTAARRKKART